jgi:hypothetical protein
MCFPLGEQYFHTQSITQLLAVTWECSALLLSWFNCGDWGAQYNPFPMTKKNEPYKCLSQAWAYGVGHSILLTTLSVPSSPWRISLTWSSLTIVLITAVSVFLKESFPFPVTDQGPFQELRHSEISIKELDDLIPCTNRYESPTAGDCVFRHIAQFGKKSVKSLISWAPFPW